jgi:hypothetical protein
MKITIVKKAEAKKNAGAICPWIVEDMATAKK